MKQQKRRTAATAEPVPATAVKRGSRKSQRERKRQRERKSQRERKDRKKESLIA